MRKWLLRIALILVGVVALLGGAVQLVLASDLPRREVIKAIEQQMGLRVSAKSLSTGWLGNTRLTDVTLALPLAEESLLTTPELKVSHSSLFSIILGRQMHVETVSIRSPKLVVLQTPDGRWNVQDALELITRAGGSHSAAKEAGERQAARDATPVQLPNLTISDGTIELVDRKGGRASFAPLEIRGVPDGLLVWKLDAALARYVSVKGRFAPGQNWNHQLRFALDDAGELLRPWMPQPPAPIHVAGSWTGRVGQEGVTGQVTFDPGSRLTNVGLQGTANIVSGGGKTILKPDGLQIALLAEAAATRPSGTHERPAAAADPGDKPMLTFTGGAIRSEGNTLTLDGLTLDVLGGSAKVNGSANLQSKAMELTAEWINVGVANDAKSDGTLKLTYATPWEGKAQIRAELNARGTASAAADSWDAKLTVSGEGDANFENFAWQLTAPTLSYKAAKRTYSASGLTLQATKTGPSFRVFNPRIGDDADSVRGQARYDTQTRQWLVELGLKRFPVLAKDDMRADIGFEAIGDPEHVEIRKLDVWVGRFEATAKGFYHYDKPKPLQLEARMNRTPLKAFAPERRPAVAAVDTSATRLERAGHAVDDDPAKAEAPVEVGGDLWGVLKIDGTVTPLDLELDGILAGQNVMFGKHRLGDLEVRIFGAARGESAWLESSQLELLSGKWKLKASYEADTDLAGLHLHVNDLKLGAFDDFVAPPPNMHGSMSLELNARLPERDAKRMTATGSWNVAGFAKSFAQKTPNQTDLKAQEIKGQIGFADGVLRIHDVTIRQGDATATAAITLDTRTGRNIRLDLTPRAFPIDTPGQGVHLRFTGGMSIDVDLATRSVTGPIKLSTPLTYKDKSVGSIGIDATLTGRGLRLNELRANLLDGQLNGTAMVPFDDLYASTVSIMWRDLNMEHLARWAEGARGFSGRMNGSLAIAPDNDPHALEPLRIMLQLRPQAARFNATAVGDADVTAFAGNTEGVPRFVIGRSVFNFAGGKLEVWGRMTRPTPTDDLFAHVDARFTDLDLDQLVHAAMPDSKPMPGKLQGTFTLYGPPAEKNRIQGEAQVRVREADLLNSQVVAGLYNLMSLGITNLDPRGRGHASARLEGGALSLLSLYYFNRGIEVRASGVMKDLAQGMKSEIQGQAVGSARPLKDIKIPLIANILRDADKVLSVIGGDVTTVKVEGTAKEPRIALMPFSEISSGLRRFILGDVNPEVQGTAAQ